MPNNYILALKEFNKDKPKWVVPKRDTVDYQKVMKIKSKLDNQKGSGQVFSMMQDEPEEEATTKLSPKRKVPKKPDTIFNLVRDREANPNYKPSRGMKKNLELLEEHYRIFHNPNFLNRMRDLAIRRNLNEDEFQQLANDTAWREAQRKIESRSNYTFQFPEGHGEGIKSSKVVI